MKVHRFALFCLATLSIASVATAQDSGHEGFVRASDGVRIHYIERGEGSAVILLHGMTGSAASNYDQTGAIGELARSHRVVAIDFRGHGKSDKPPSADSYRPDRLVEDVIAVLDDRKIGRAHLVGYSIGGSTVRRLASAAPKRVLSVTLGGDGFFDGGWRVLGTEDPVGNDPSPPAVAQPMWDTDPDSPIYRAFSEGVSKPSVFSDRPPFGTLGLPVLQILGQFDYPNTMSKLLKQNAPDYRLVVLPARTHLTALADPRFAETVAEFIAEHEASR